VDDVEVKLSRFMKPSNVHRVTAFAIGVAAAGASYVSIHRLVMQNEGALSDLYVPKPKIIAQEPEPIIGAPARAYVVEKWNAAVDMSVGALATELAKMGL
jgi:hypothetical protein